MKQRKANHLSPYKTTNDIYYIPGLKDFINILFDFRQKTLGHSSFLEITHCASLAWNLTRCPKTANRRFLRFYWPVRKAVSGTSGSRCTTTRWPVWGGRRTYWTSRAWIASWHPVRRSPSNIRKKIHKS